MSKDTQGKLISIALTALVAILTVFGYNVLIVQPQIAALEAQAAPAFAGAVGDTNFTNVVAEDITATDDLAVTDDVVISSDLQVVGNLSVNATPEYPITNGTDDQEISFGRILTPVAAATVAAAAHGVSTPIAAGCSPTIPAIGGGWTCAAAIGSSGQITLTVLEADATPVAGALNWWVMGQ